MPQPERYIIQRKFGLTQLIARVAEIAPNRPFSAANWPIDRAVRLVNDYRLVVELGQDVAARLWPDFQLLAVGFGNEHSLPS